MPHTGDKRRELSVFSAQQLLAPCLLLIDDSEATSQRFCRRILSTGSRCSQEELTGITILGSCSVEGSGNEQYRLTASLQQLQVAPPPKRVRSTFTTTPPNPINPSSSVPDSPRGRSPDLTATSFTSASPPPDGPDSASRHRHLSVHRRGGNFVARDFCLARAAAAEA